METWYAPPGIWTGQDLAYFSSRGDPDSDLTTGISAINLDNGETVDLVAPERGYASLVQTGRRMDDSWHFRRAFMEDAACLRITTSKTRNMSPGMRGWEVASWSPNGSLLTYDRITYVPTGDERLYLRPRQGGEQLLGPDYEGPAYASQPVFSPAGDQIAYLAHLEGPETFIASIMVLDLSWRRTQITRPVRGCLGDVLGTQTAATLFSALGCIHLAKSLLSTSLMAAKLC